MSFFNLSFILTIFSNLLMTIFLFLTSKGRKNNILWGYFCLAVTIWGIGGYLASRSLNFEVSYFWWRFSNIASIFCPVLFFHFVHNYLNLSKKLFLKILYSSALFLLTINFVFRQAFFADVSFMFNEFFYMDWTKSKEPLYLIFYISYYVILLIYAFGLALIEFGRSVGTRRNQLKYFIVGMMIGFLGAHIDFLPIFGIKIYPHLNILIAIYPIIIGYAIIRYRLMDITLAITRTGIFIAVYSLVLGLPFALAFGWRENLKLFLGENWWMVPLVSEAALATVGPFIYLYIQKKAEDRLLAEQRAYQSTLRQASLGMGRVKELPRLLQLIVRIVTRAVQIEHSSVFLWDESSAQYTLKAAKGYQRERTPGVVRIAPQSALREQLMKTPEPLVYEEIKQRAQDYGTPALVAMEADMRELDAALAVPCFIDQKLIAIVILGKKISGKLYTQDDLAVFAILANQAALAIENAQFYEDMKKTHEQLFRAEKMATIGTMADGLSHQINNRLHAMGFISGDALDTVRSKKNSANPPSPDMQAFIDEMEFALERIHDNVKRGGEIVEGLLKYTRKGEEGMSPIELGKLVDASLEMVQFKIRLHELAIIRNFDHSTPKIRGNFTQLQEVLFNIIDNSYDAMMQRRADLKEEGYKPTLTIGAEKKDGQIEIAITDNGIGVKKEDVQKLFTPFFTTKLSSKKGTGLGLYVIRQIIEENHKGRVHFMSEHGKGSMTLLLLPEAG